MHDTVYLGLRAQWTFDGATGSKARLKIRPILSGSGPRPSFKIQQSKILNPEALTLDFPTRSGFGGLGVLGV